jgi:hypothetical protein
MKTPRTYLRAALGICLGICLAAQQAPPIAQAPQALPPERAEIAAAQEMADPAARAKELWRIKAAHPDSAMMAAIDSALLDALNGSVSDFGELAAAQSKIIDAYKGEDAPRAMPLLAMACAYLVGHDKAVGFPKPELLRTVQGYRGKADGLLADPRALAALQVPEAYHEMIVGQFRTLMDLSLAKAQLLGGDSKAALATLEEYGKKWDRSANFYSLLGEALANQKRDAEALEAYISAIVEGDVQSMEPARAVHARLNKGKADGFDDMIERRSARAPFHPEALRPPADWKGKVVLAELFTGSECPPCVGADFGFDGLLESHPSKYLAVLVHHLPIPRPDPMMNPSTKRRGDFYEIRGTPTVIIDGAGLAVGGGARKDAERLYGQYREAIDGRLGQDPAVAISASASLDKKGDKVNVKCEFSKAVEGAEFYMALVQAEEKYRGGNGILFHRMVVRHLVQLPTIPSHLKMEPSIDLAYVEKAADEHMTELETTSTRFKDFKFPVRHHKLDRSRLKVVLFVQDPNTKQVHNAVVADVAVETDGKP